eukprot:TRINITY_DN46684_c0_g1_i1.p1 TRINITY_DN46684_c0_g1~~TRINITY_DN46684_c0_g1_i1.p1  ORF type:complete len:265 (+),score=54.34 TRINITY_DN46684_c0_g1_i1:97-891(+)
MLGRISGGRRGNAALDIPLSRLISVRASSRFALDGDGDTVWRAETFPRTRSAAKRKAPVNARFAELAKDVPLKVAIVLDSAAARSASALVTSAGFDPRAVFIPNDRADVYEKLANTRFSVTRLTLNAFLRKFRGARRKTEACGRVGAAFLDFQTRWGGSWEDATSPCEDVAEFMELADPQGAVLGLTIAEPPAALGTHVAALAVQAGLAAIEVPEEFRFSGGRVIVSTRFWLLGSPSSSWLQRHAADVATMEEYRRSSQNAPAT